MLTLVIMSPGIQAHYEPDREMDKKKKISKANRQTNTKKYKEAQSV